LSNIGVGVIRGGVIDRFPNGIKISLSPMQVRKAGFSQEFMN